MRKRVFVTLPNGRVRYEFAKEKKTETAMTKPSENTMMPKAEPKYLGGGWYLTADGRKVRKKDLEAGDINGSDANYFGNSKRTTGHSS